MSRLILGVVLLFPSTLEAQGDSRVFFVRTGLTRFDLGELKEIMREAVAYYRNEGLPMELQEAYPANGLIGAEVVQTMGLIRIGAGFYYSRTLAFSGFRDNSGTIRIRSDVSALMGQAIFGLRAWFWPDGSIYFCLKPGIFFGEWELSESIVFGVLTNLNREERIEARAAGFFGDAVVGVNQRVLPWLLGEFEVGYRESHTAKLERVKGGPLGPGFNASGFVVGISMGVEF